MILLSLSLQLFRHFRLHSEYLYLSPALIMYFMYYFIILVWYIVYNHAPSVYNHCYDIIIRDRVDKVATLNPLSIKHLCILFITMLILFKSLIVLIHYLVIFDFPILKLYLLKSCVGMFFSHNDSLLLSYYNIPIIIIVFG